MNYNAGDVQQHSPQERGSSTIHRLERDNDKLMRERDEARRDLENHRQLVTRYRSEREAARMEVGILHKEVSLLPPME